MSADVGKTIDRVRGGLTRLQTVISHFFFLQMLAWQHMAHVAHSACLSGRSCQCQSVTARGHGDDPAPPSSYYWTINNLPETHRQQSRARAALGVRTVTEPENQLTIRHAITQFKRSQCQILMIFMAQNGV